MKAYFNLFVIKLLWLLSPVLQWFDHTFTIKASVKKVNGDDYYTYRDLINRGVVFITDTTGQGSNLINPSKGKHGAIYYGKGLASHLKRILQSLNYGIETEPESAQKELDKIKFNRLHRILNDYKVNDEICYVIEAVGAGVVPTNLVKFMTTKDAFKAFEPNFCESDIAKNTTMSNAGNNAVHDLGLGYDYGFSDGDDTKYCFEVAVDAYLRLNSKCVVIQETILGVKFYLASAFTEDSKNWKKIIDLPIHK